jgi:hypothetical protein
MYQNHYNILEMYVISNTHLLLLSDENIIVIAMPLIPSTDLSLAEGMSGSSNHEMFESAIVFIAS